jgi:hypothetical protein
MCKCRQNTKKAPYLANRTQPRQEEPLVALELSESAPTPLYLPDVEVPVVEGGEETEKRSYVVVDTAGQRYKDAIPLVGRKALVRPSVRQAMVERWPRLFAETEEINKLFVHQREQVNG